MTLQQTLICRSKSGIEFHTFDTIEKKINSPNNVPMDGIRQIRQSANGRLLAITQASELCIYKFINDFSVQEVCKISVSCSDFVLSPLGRYVATFERMSTETSTQQFNVI